MKGETAAEWRTKQKKIGLFLGSETLVYKLVVAATNNRLQRRHQINIYYYYNGSDGLYTRSPIMSSGEEEKTGGDAHRSRLLCIAVLRASTVSLSSSSQE